MSLVPFSAANQGSDSGEGQLSNWPQWLATTAVAVSLIVGCSKEPLPAFETVQAAKDPRDLPAPLQLRAPTSVEVELTAKEVIADLGASRPAVVWTFGGTVPGPFIRVREGDNVVVTLKNDPSNVEPHSIDLHAVIGPGGGATVTEVKPGESKSLSFIASHQGAYLYHCAAEHEPWEHVAYGMYGVILVEPPEGLPPVDHEFYVAQSEWYLAVAGAEGDEAEGEESEEEEEHEHEASSVPEGVFQLDEAAARREEPTLFTFNGHKAALASADLFGGAIRSFPGERIRIVFGNAGPNATSSFHVIGNVFDRVVAGSFDDVRINEETVSVPPGSAVVLEFTNQVPGTYEIVDHALFRAARGAFGLMHVDANGEWPEGLYSPEPEPEPE